MPIASSKFIEAQCLYSIGNVKFCERRRSHYKHHLQKEDHSSQQKPQFTEKFTKLGYCQQQKKLPMISLL